MPRSRRPAAPRRPIIDLAAEKIVPITPSTIVEHKGPAFRVTDEMLARARVMRPRRRAVVTPEQMFAFPEFPPGVAPKSAGLAQDANIFDFSSWAIAQQANAWIGSAFAEGQMFLGYSLLSTLAQRPEYRVPTEEIASEMTREWIDIKRAGEEEKSQEVKDLEDEVTRLNVRGVLQQAAEHDGFFGRGHVYLDLDGKNDDRDELLTSIGDGRDATSRNKVSPEKPILALRTVEPVWTYPNQYNSNNPLREDWYRPETWSVMGLQVHRTRLLTLIGRPVPDMLKPAYAFGGLAMSQMLKPYVDNWLRTRQAVSDLIHSFSVSGLKTNMAATAGLGGQDMLSRVDLFNTLRDNAGAMVLDKDSEEWFNVSTPLSTLDQLQAQAQEHMAAIARIPLVKLLGLSPHGLNASSEGELRAFYDWIKAFQDRLFRAPLTTILGFIQLSLWSRVDPSITFEFNPLWQLDEAQKATVEQTKAATHQVYVDMGAVSPDEVREALAGDHDSAYDGIDLSDPAPGPPDAGGGEAPTDGGGVFPGQPPPSEEDATDDAELGTWRKKAAALFADEDDLRYWTRRAERLFEDRAKPDRWCVLAQKLFETSNTGEPLLTWMARVAEVRASWSDLAAAIPRNVTTEPLPPKTWADRVQREFPGDLGDPTPEVVVLPLVKAAQAEVAYEYPATGADNCAACAHFEAPKRCARVDGLIEPEAWCKLFEARRQRAVPFEDSRWAADAEFEESKHPRGQPGNAGQFGAGGGGKDPSGWREVYHNAKMSGASPERLRRVELPEYDRAAKELEEEINENPNKGVVPAAGPDEKYWIDETGRHQFPLDSKSVIQGPIQKERNDIRNKLNITDFEGVFNDLPIQSIALNDLVTYQNGVEPNRLKPWDPKTSPPIYVVKYRGEKIIIQGNHRVASAWVDGAKKIFAKILDLDDIKNEWALKEDLRSSAPP